MILVVSKSKRNSDRFCEALNIMGYLSQGVTFSSALNEISPRYRAVIMLSNTTSSSALSSSVISACSSPALKIPVFSVGTITDNRIAEMFGDDASHSFIIKRIFRHLVLNEKPIIGRYKCAGFDASCDSGRVLYFDKEIKLTQTEKMILRYLTRAYPLPASANEIIKYSLRPSRSPEPSSIRTHISVMNKKFKSEIGRPMIEFCDKEGYILITPERKFGILR